MHEHTHTHTHEYHSISPYSSPPNTHTTSYRFPMDPAPIPSCDGDFGACLLGLCWVSCWEMSLLVPCTAQVSLSTVRRTTLAAG